MADQKISVHNLADLKNTSDDAIPTYLHSLKFKQSHTLTDVRLALGYGAFILCAATFYWDYKLGFESTKYYTAAAVALYSLLNGALTYWIWGVEKGTVYVGSSPGGDKIEISTKTKKHIPIYEVTITYYKSTSPKTPNIITITRPFTEWFDAAGHMVPLPFRKMLAGNVPMIGAGDPTMAVIGGGSAGGKVVQSSPDAVGDLRGTLDAIRAGNATGLESSAATPVKRSTKSKKAAKP